MQYRDLVASDKLQDARKKQFTVFTRYGILARVFGRMGNSVPNGEPKMRGKL